MVVFLKNLTPKSDPVGLGCHVCLFKVSDRQSAVAGFGHRILAKRKENLPVKLHSRLFVCLSVWLSVCLSGPLDLPRTPGGAGGVVSLNVTYQDFQVLSGTVPIDVSGGSSSLASCLHGGSGIIVAINESTLLCLSLAANAAVANTHSPTVRGRFVPHSYITSASFFLNALWRCLLATFTRPLASCLAADRL